MKKGVLRSIPLFMIVVLSCKQQEKEASNEIIQTYTSLIDSLESTPARDSIRYQSLSVRIVDLEKIYDFPDSIELNRVFVSAGYIRKRDPDSAFQILLQAFDLAVMDGDSMQMARLAYKMGKWKLAEGNNKTSLTFLKRAEKAFRFGGKSLELARTQLAISQSYREMNDLESAQRTSLEAIRLFETAGTSAASEKAGAYITIGNLLADIGSKDQATGYYWNAYHTYQQQPDTIGMSESLGNIGLLYRKSKPDSARFYYQWALELSPFEKHPFESVVFLYNKTNLSLDQKDYASTLAGYDSIMALCKKHGIYQGIPRIYSGYASVASSLGNHEKAVGYLRAARKYADSMSMSQVAHWLLKEEYDAVGLAGDSAARFRLLKRIKAIDDSVLNISKLKAINELEIQYRTELRNREVQALRLRLRNISMLAVLSIAMVLVAVYGLILFRQRNKSYAMLVRRYQELSEVAHAVSPLTNKQDAPGESPVAARELNDQGVEDEIDIPLSEDEIRENHAAFQAFLAMMQEERPWLNPDLKVEDLAARLQISPRKMAMVMRAGGDENVNRRINKFRVDQVIAHFKDPLKDPIRTDALGEMSGFSSRTHFFRVFKEFTGVTPGMFRDIIRNQRCP
jgi:AraC-like DNA-binding protein